MMDIRKLTPGDRILDYRILESIGEGGFGEVFRAEHEVLGRVVAIKVPRDLEALSALRMEGVIQAKLDHPGIVKTLEISISHNPPYVVMEYVEGENLRRLLERGAMPWRRAVKVLIDICEALDHAHKQGVIHGDVKPSNILVPADGDASARVTDFGLGRVFESSQQANLQISRSLNFVESASEVVGTLRYLAPEVQRGEGPDEQSDVYSLGMLMFEMLTGTQPEGREVPSEVKKGIPETLDELFCRCFVRKSRRIKRVSDVIAELRSILENDGKAPKSEAEDEAVEPTLVMTPPPIEVLTLETEELCAAEAETQDYSCFGYEESEAPHLDGFQTELWDNVRDMLSFPEGFEEIDSHGFDVAYGVTNDGDPQHRIFAAVVPEFDGEAARQFVTQGTRVFDLEKGLWEKEVTFIIATHNIREKEKVDWALRSFSTGWWRRRRVVLYDLSNDTLHARDYGCDPNDNELKKHFLEQLQCTNRELIRQRELMLAHAEACRMQSSRLGTALTVFSTFCVIAVGLSFQGAKRVSKSDQQSARPVAAEVRSIAELPALERKDDALLDEPVKKPKFRFKLPVAEVEDDR